ncbi:unnamed protein product [Parnassius apollo]|uniref:(apollo) hypothetical protein n=1 Tax=Parnassius apollo TaxID=110799 RepID=A0A8S3WZP5_PARAO|nr:unnamed protein product [Parnassius apollo]
MMQVLTSINVNQMEAINRISKDVSSLKEHVKDLKTEIDSLRFENEKIKRNIENVYSKYNEKDKQIETLDSEIKNLQITKLIDPLTTTTVSNTIEETVMAELSDRLVRSKNIIITGLMETKISDYKERKEAEKREVLGLLKKISNDCTKPKSITRLGKYAPDKQRLLKVCFSTPKEAISVLRSKSNEKLNPIKIFADRTLQQQSFYKKT